MSAPGLSDAELFGPAPIKPAVAAPVVAPPSVGLSDAELFSPPPQAHTMAPTPATPSLWDQVVDRFGTHFNQGAQSTIQGGLANVFDSAITGGVEKTLREQGQNEAADRYHAAGVALQQRQQQHYDQMPGWNAQGGTVDKAANLAAATGGEVLGALLSPESWASLPEKAGTFIEQALSKGAQKVVPKVLAPAAKVAARVATKGAEQAVINTATDPAVQALNIASGKQDHYDPVQTALAPALGFVIGGSLHVPAEAVGVLRGAADAFRQWRAARGEAKPATAGPAHDAPPTPQEIEEFAASPEMAAFYRANGITHPDDPRIIQLQDRLSARRAAEAKAQRVPTQAQPEVDQAQAEHDAIQNGEMHPGMASAAGRAPRPEVPPVMPVTPQGQADTGDLAIRAAADKFGARGGLPVPTEAQPTRMTADEVARSRAKMTGGNANTAQPERMVAPEGRLPQTASQVQDQRQAGEAFTQAAHQGQIAAENEVVDTQPAARPDGVGATQVVLDDGFPVRVVSRTVKEVGGKHVDMATVHRYDPRTGQLDLEAVPYEVPAKQLKTSNYTPDQPRMAQDFVRRAEGPPAPEQPRTPAQPIQREPAQTFRTTPRDPNQDFPGATRPGPEDGTPPEGRSPLPDQPEGPHPGPQRPRVEEEAIRDFEARQRDPEGADYRARQAQGGRTGDTKASPTAAAPGADGRFPVDDRGYVASDKGGPVRFADQKQAAKWIVNVGHKTSPDQIFEIENHPGGKGFTVHERGRAAPTEPPPSDGPSSQPGSAGGARGAGKAASPGALPPPRGARHLDQAGKDVADARGAPQARPARPEGSLFDAIRDKGGIRDDRGDVAQIMQGFKGEAFKKRVVNPDGLAPDEMRRQLQADGWFGGEPRHGANAMETGNYPGDDIQDLYDLMDREARGEKVYHPDHVPADRTVDYEAQRARDEEMDRAGVEPGDSPDVAARKLAEYRASEEADFHAREDQRKLDEAVSGGLSDQELEDLYGHGYPREAAEDVAGGQEAPSGHEGGRGSTDDIPGWEEDAGRVDPEAGNAEHAPAGDAGNGSGERQTRVGGTEHAADADELKARAARRAAEEKQQNPRAYSGKAQKGHADDGLFGDRSERNQSDMFADEGQRDAADNLSNKFFSNPVGDPEVWRLLGRTLGDAFGWAKGEAEAWSRHLEDMLSSLPKPEAREGSKFDRAWQATYPMRRWLEVLAYSNDGRLRSMAARFKSDPIREIADMFFAAPRGGRDGAVAKTYFEAINERRGRWLNQLEDVLSPFKHMSLKDKDAAMNQIGRLVQNPGAIKAGTSIHDAADEITRILKEAHTYLREANVDVGEVKRGYLPRIENVNAVMANPEKFKSAAARAFAADGVPMKDAKEAAEKWFQRVMLGDLGIHHDGNDFMDRGAGSQTFTKGRILSKKADEIMGDFYLRNPADILPAYISRAVQKAEWSRRLGPRDRTSRPPRGVDAEAWHSDPDGKWQDLKARMIAEGNGSQIPDVVRILKSQTGNMGGKWAMSGAGRGAINFARTWSALTYLPRAVFASLSEPVNISLRTGNTLDAGRAYVRTLQHWLPMVRNQAGTKYLREMARDLGFIGEAIDQLTMLQRVGNEDGSRLARQVQSQFFARTGLTQLTEANRMASVQIGMTFIRRLASDVVNQSHYQTIARRMLAEMGVGENTVKGRNGDPVESFARWVMDLDKPKADDILKGGDMGSLYHTALGRFVSQTVMAPSGATRSYFSQHPLGGLIYNLQSFNYAFQKNVLNRITAMTKDAVNPKSGLNAAERAYALMPLVNLIPLLMVSYGVGEIRDMLFQDPARKGQPPMTFVDKAKRAVSRAGITGSMDAPYNAVTGARYQRDPLTALLGPVVGGGDTLVGDALDAGSDRNSPNTNTFERKAAKDVYQMIVQPTLEAGALMAAPETTALGFGLGTGAIYGLSHPAAREKFVKSLFGPPLPKN